MDNQQVERTKCYSCDNQWIRDPSDRLICPRCHSEFIEILDANSEEALPFLPEDPDEDDIDDFNHRLHHPDNRHLHDHGPAGQEGGPPNALFNNLLSMLGGIVGGQQAPQEGMDRERHQSPFREVHIERTGPGGSRFTYHSSYTIGGLPGRGGPGDDDFHQIMNSILLGPGMRQQPGQTMRGGPAGFPDGQGLPPNPLAQMLFSLFDPTAARHGDAVFTQEALDRVISELMETNQMGNAPGPADSEAISQLPKVKLTKDMIGDENKDEADCSICMEAAKLGDEVTRLFCSHWFHGPCIEAWLREHDTCPHCRKGIEEARAEAEGRDPSAGGSSDQKPSGGRPNDTGNGGNGSGPSGRRDFSPDHSPFFGEPPPMPGSYHHALWLSSPPPVPLTSRPNISNFGSGSQHDPFIIPETPHRSTRPHMPSRHSSGRSGSHSHRSHSGSHHRHSSSSSNHRTERSNSHRSHRGESRHTSPVPVQTPTSSGGIRETIRNLWGGGR